MALCPAQARLRASGLLRLVTSSRLVPRRLPGLLEHSLRSTQPKASRRLNRSGAVEAVAAGLGAGLTKNAW